MTSWKFLVADVLFLWAAILFGLGWQMYWSDRDHHRR